MKTLIVALAAISLMAFSSCSNSSASQSKSSIALYDLPSDWFKAGSDPDKYDMGSDKTGGQDGKSAATLKSNKKKIKGFGTLMQMCRAEKYLGKKIKMSGSMKSENVKDWAGFWLRVDGSKGETLSFDNMQDRAIKKATPWTNYEIILDVPDKAVLLAYGALLSGTGQIWFDNIKFEIVGDATKTTGTGSDRLDEPANLDFEK